MAIRRMNVPGPLFFEGGREAGGPSLDYFKVRTREGLVFLLRYNALFDGWAIVVPGSRT